MGLLSETASPISNIPQTMCWMHRRPILWSTKIQPIWQILLDYDIFGERKISPSPFVVISNSFSSSIFSQSGMLQPDTPCTFKPLVLYCFHLHTLFYYIYIFHCTQYLFHTFSRIWSPSSIFNQSNNLILIIFFF